MTAQMLSPASHIGAVIDRQYQIEVLLGSGGMGEVYLAEQLGMGRRVVVKLLHPHLLASEAFHVRRRTGSTLRRV